MSELNKNEEFLLPVSFERAHEACARAIALDWSVLEETPSRIRARETSFLGVPVYFGEPIDLSVILCAQTDGVLVTLYFWQDVGAAKGFALVICRAELELRVKDVCRRLLAEAPGARAVSPSPDEEPVVESAPASANIPPEPALSASPSRAIARRIFISYRRRESADVTGRIYDRLVEHFGEGSVFQDVEDIPLGLDFIEDIQGVMGKCDAFLAIIGTQWLDVAYPLGGRLLDDPRDNVRLEIEGALARQIPLIPVLVGGASMPREELLPETLRKLAFRNATQVRPNPDFRTDMTRLIEGLERLFSQSD